MKLLLETLIFFAFSLFLFALTGCESDNRGKECIPKDLQLIHYRGIPTTPNNLSGIIIYNSPLEVSFPMDGKIENENTSLLPGTRFKKNELLVKLNRTEILYELIIQRLEFKKLILNLLPDIQHQFPDSYEKWKNFEAQIQHTEELPDFPKFDSKEEKNYFIKQGVLDSYFSTKVKATEVEKYFFVAPFDGVILESSVQPGATIEKGKVILKIGKSDDLMITSTLSLNLFNLFQKEDKFIIYNEQQKEIGEAQLQSWENILSDSSTIELSFKIRSGEFSPYEKVSLQVASRLEQLQYIPNSAIINDSIFILVKDQIAKIHAEVITKKGDSSLLKGIPSALIITNPSDLNRSH